MSATIVRNTAMTMMFMTFSRSTTAPTTGLPPIIVGQMLHVNEAVDVKVI